MHCVSGQRENPRDTDRCREDCSAFLARKAPFACAVICGTAHRPRHALLIQARAPHSWRSAAWAGSSCIRPTAMARNCSASSKAVSAGGSDRAWAATGPPSTAIEPSMGSLTVTSIRDRSGFTLMFHVGQVSRQFWGQCNGAPANCSAQRSIVMLDKAFEALLELVLPQALVGVARETRLEAVERQLVGMPGRQPCRGEHLGEVFVDVAAKVGRVVRIDRGCQAGIEQPAQVVLRQAGEY